MSPDPILDILFRMLSDLPLAGIFWHLMNQAMKKDDIKTEKLIATFEIEIRACEHRYTMVFNELMRLKESVRYFEDD